MASDSKSEVEKSTAGSNPVATAQGELVERSMALVLKTKVGDEPTVGSNPTLTAMASR